MSFDPSRVAVPFRMQPGLQRLDAGARHLTPLAPDSTLWQEKKRVFDSGASQLAVPGFDRRVAVDAILAQARSEGLDARAPVELAFEEDFALLDGATTTLPWLCVAVPSHWAPEEKLGLPFDSVHAPVADNQALLAASRQLVRLVTGGGHFERFVWTVSPSGRFDQHPHRHAREPWPETADPHEFARHCRLRSERQTFFPVAGASGQAIFTIRVMLQPLQDAVRSQDDARRLHASLSSMSEAVVHYKGLAPARDRLLAWLALRSA